MFDRSSMVMYYDVDKRGYFDPSDAETDECTLRGVKCEDQRIVEIHFDFLQKQTAVADMDWVPSTVERLSCSYVTLEKSWTAEALPQGLKLFYIFSYIPSSARFMRRPVNFQRLPRQMDELYSIAGVLGVFLCIDSLAQSMRILVLTMRDFKKAFVSFEHLPASLKILSLHCTRLEMDTKIRAMGKMKEDSRVTTAHMLLDSRKESRFPAYLLR